MSTMDDNKGGEYSQTMLLEVGDWGDSKNERSGG